MGRRFIEIIVDVEAMSRRIKLCFCCILDGMLDLPRAFSCQLAGVTSFFSFAEIVPLFSFMKYR